MSEKTNLGLSEFSKKALNENWFYLWGSYGQIATENYLESNIRQYPENKIWRSYAAKAIGKTRFSDCYGLVKAYLNWTGNNTNPGFKRDFDLNTKMAYDKSKEKGTLATLPEIPGIILYMKGHVGVYIGGGEFIECQGGGVGMLKGKIHNGKIIKGSKFTHWFKDMHINYLENKISADKEDNKILTLDKTKIKINGDIYEVNRILKDDKNFIELRDLEQAGFKISYDKENKIPVIEH